MGIIELRSIKEWELKVMSVVPLSKMYWVIHPYIASTANGWCNDPVIPMTLGRLVFLVNIWWALLKSMFLDLLYILGCTMYHKNAGYFQPPSPWIRSVSRVTRQYHSVLKNIEQVEDIFLGMQPTVTSDLTMVTTSGSSFLWHNNSSPTAVVQISLYMLAMYHRPQSKGLVHVLMVTFHFFHMCTMVDDGSG